ncbi:NAD(P)H-binding protein [Streptomyces phaeochromogenes]|uniref:NAD(P)H-binding protein n=1 Tax=Streptomyces phaeochromogenes TaxID=1923 RepID=UPI00340E400C
MRTVLVTGGTGTTGRRVAALLRTRGVAVRTASRHPVAGDDQHVIFDWADPRTFATAVDGVDRVFLVAPLSDSDPASAVGGFLDAAVAAGTRRVVLLSASAVTDAPSGLGALPPLVRARVPESAVLRPSWFMQNFVGNHPVAVGIRERGRITTATGRGRVAFIDPDDIAAVAGELLLGESIPDGELILTGPQALSYDEAAAVVGEVTGTAVHHTSITVEELTAAIEATGVPHDYARVLAEMDEEIAGGSEERITTTVQDVTDRAPRSFRDFLIDAHQTTSNRPERAVA